MNAAYFSNFGNLAVQEKGSDGTENKPKRWGPFPEIVHLIVEKNVVARVISSLASSSKIDVTCTISSLASS